LPRAYGGRNEEVQQLLDTLSEHGVEAATIDEDGVVVVEVRCDDEGKRDCAELLSQIEGWLAEEGLPFVPEEQDDRILIRPPAG
jgi:glycine cleavage system protein P-like pyridoxal-binding family